MATRVHRTVLKLTVEYLLLTLPILLYIGLESMRLAEPKHFLTSPEWSIATIFIVLQTYRIYSEEMQSTVGRAAGQCLVIACVLVTSVASVNIYLAADTQEASWQGVLVTWVLLCVSSLLFLYVAGAAIYSCEEDN